MKYFKFSIFIFILIVLTMHFPSKTIIYASAETIYTKNIHNEIPIKEVTDLTQNKNDTTNQNIESEETEVIIGKINENKELETEIAQKIPQPSKPNSQTQQNKVKNQTTTKINLSNYNEKISYNGFSEVEIKIINDVLSIYEKGKDSGLEKFSKQIDYIPTYQEYRNAMSFFHIYYGIQEEIFDIVFDVHIHGNEYAYIEIYVDNMNSFNERRNKNTEEILNIISNFSEGTEKEKINQIVNYISKQTTYVDGNYDVEDILFKGKGVCNAYALTMTRFCQLLGIQNDICIGNTPSGKHAWNKITYSDGSIEYFDITFYDTSNSDKYLNMSSSHYIVESINLYY